MFRSLRIINQILEKSNQSFEPNYLLKNLTFMQQSNNKALTVNSLDSL